MKALIVDDSTINIKVATKILEKFGITVESVFDGESALNRLEETEYDVIFMDIMMPILDGIQTFNLMKQKEKFKTPVIALTADIDKNANEKYLKLGFYAYIGKPINIEKLKTILDSLKEEQK